MKKLKYILFILLTIILCPIVVLAENTPNGVRIENNESENDNTFNLYCEYYNGDYIIIDRAETGENGNVESSFSLFDEASDATLKQYGFMHDDGKLDCPLYLYGIPSGVGGPLGEVKGFSNSEVSEDNIISVQLDTSLSICTGKCTGNQNSFENDFWTCNYTGPSGSLTMKYDGLYLINFPDGYAKEVNKGDISSSCADIFYNTKTHEFEYANYDYSEYIKNHTNYDPTQHDYLCGRNKDNFEYFCNNGECKFPGNKNINCNELNEKVDGGKLNLERFCAEDGVKKPFRFIGYLLLVAKIVVPLLLIVFGTIDFAKATIASDQDAIQKSAKTLIYRALAGLAIFILPTIVNFTFKVIMNSESAGYNDCRICVFEPNKCP